MSDLACTLLVIGAGPGGYSAAIRAGQLGVDTIVVDAGPPGGTCLNVGCIPSKALIHVADEYARARAVSLDSHALGIRAAPPKIDLAVAAQWRDGVVTGLRSGLETLFRAAKVRRVEGWASIVDGKSVSVASDEGSVHIRAEHLVLATGSRPFELPSLPWGGAVISSTEALDLAEVPRRLVVVGGGYIGLELGTAYAKLGAEVTVVEMSNRVLPTLAAELSAAVRQGLDRLGIGVLTDTIASGLGADGTSVMTTSSDGSTRELPADRVLVAVGRRPVTQGWGLDVLDLDRDGPFVRIDERCRTSMDEVYAVGDLTGEPLLAHRAIAQGELVAELVAGLPRAWDAVCVPAVVFTDPEVVTVGATTQECRSTGVEVIEGRAAFAANGRAHASGDAEGFVQVVARADDHVILGIHGVGAEIAELAAAFALAIEMGARLEDVAGTMHAHPTRGEALHEAAARALRSRQRSATSST